MLQQILLKRPLRWSLAVVSGLLMVLSFPYTGSIFPLAFVAWVPLLLLESHYVKGTRSFPLFFQAYLTFFIYNLGTTWWIYNASSGGAYMAFICNSLLMAIAFYMFHRLKKSLGTHWITPLLLCTWMSFEFLHFNWELSWPWLTLGNVFARVPELVQWYAWTGVFGGTLWILGVNLAIFRWIIARKDTPEKPAKPALMRIAGILLIPLLVSLIQYWTYNPKGETYEVVVVQPNTDPYSEKFGAMSNDAQLLRIMSLADHLTTPHTKLVVAPETALHPNPPYINEAELHQLTSFHLLMERRARWHNASFLIGATTEKNFEYRHSRASRPDYGGPGFIETYNSSILFKENRTPEVVHKSKLVLGVEFIPFSNLIPSLEELSIEMGGSYGSLGIEDKGPSVMTSAGVKLAPVVCYESVYGGFVSKQCKKGAQLIAIITNDGWWGNTPGYKQHFAFARLRAVENRKCVVRSANTGKSGIINERGDVVRETGWWKELAFREQIRLNETKTLYQLLGDYLAYFAVAGLAALWVLRFTKLFRRSAAR